MCDSRDRLTEINLDDLVAAFGWGDRPTLAAVLRTIFHRVASKFSAQMIDFDRDVGSTDLPAGARRILKRYVKDVRIFGKENIPASGGALFLSNHPGMADTLCLFAAIDRADLRVIALNRPFLQSLPNASNHLFYTSDNDRDRMSAVKKTATHLRSGGAVLTFPAGKIEPDPDAYPGALESLQAWTDSAGVFLRFAPQIKIVPVLVRGVLWEKAVRHPLTRLKPAGEERETLGAAFQLLAHLMLDVKPVTVRVQFGHPVTLEEVGSTDVAPVHAAVLKGMQGLLTRPYEGNGVSAFQP